MCNKRAFLFKVDFASVNYPEMVLGVFEFHDQPQTLEAPSARRVF